MSAWVVAIHHLAYGRVKVEKSVLEVNTPEYNQEVQRRLDAYYANLNAKALRASEAEVLAKRGSKPRVHWSKRGRMSETFGRR